jgi:hypothetical protein
MWFEKPKRQPEKQNPFGITPNGFLRTGLL